MAKIDYEYETTEEQVRAYLRIPEIDRLRWLEELCTFTCLARQTPAATPRPDVPPTTDEGS
jgi:hypothetical protein